MAAILDQLKLVLRGNTILEYLLNFSAFQKIQKKHTFVYSLNPQATVGNNNRDNNEWCEEKCNVLDYICWRSLVIVKFYKKWTYLVPLL